jgi:hypothetical protein
MTGSYQIAPLSSIISKVLQCCAECVLLPGFPCRVENSGEKQCFVQRAEKGDILNCLKQVQSGFLYHCVFFEEIWQKRNLMK